MGVLGLWTLLDPVGRPVPVETLSGRVLAVDVSIWLNQAVRGFRDQQGAGLANAHLLGLYHRVCKLMFYRQTACIRYLTKNVSRRLLLVEFAFAFELSPLLHLYLE